MIKLELNSIEFDQTVAIIHKLHKPSRGEQLDKVVSHSFDHFVYPIIYMEILQSLSHHYPLTNHERTDSKMLIGLHR